MRNDGAKCCSELVKCPGPNEREFAAVGNTANSKLERRRRRSCGALLATQLPLRRSMSTVDCRELESEIRRFFVVRCSIRSRLRVFKVKRIRRTFFWRKIHCYANLSFFAVFFGNGYKILCFFFVVSTESVNWENRFVASARVRKCLNDIAIDYLRCTLQLDALVVWDTTTSVRGQFRRLWMRIQWIKLNHFTGEKLNVDPSMCNNGQREQQPTNGSQLQTAREEEEVNCEGKPVHSSSSPMRDRL